MTTALPHQIEGINLIVNSPYAALFDDPGTGKTFQVVRAADELFATGQIDAVLVVCPAQCRSVWSEPSGEIAKHSQQPVEVMSVGSHFSWRTRGHHKMRRLRWLICSYESIRRELRAVEVRQIMRGRRALMVLDESHCIKDHRTAQWDAVNSVSKEPFAVRRVILTGSPCDSGLGDLYTQFAFLDWQILGYKSYYSFRARHGIMQGRWNKVVRWKYSDWIHEKTRPYTLRRQESDVHQLPNRTDRRIPVTMDKKSWDVYCQMEDNLAVELDSGIASAANVGILLTRLSQIAAGYLTVQESENAEKKTAKVGNRKIEAALEWIAQHAWIRDKDGNVTGGDKIIVWTRFKAEVSLIADALRGRGYNVIFLTGGQSRGVRQNTIDQLMVSPQPGDKPTVCLANAVAGKQGLNLQRGVCHTLYVSRDWSVTTNIQSEKRTYRHGQVRDCTVTTIEARGPNGERTIDNAILETVKERRGTAQETMSGWRRIAQRVAYGR